MSRTFRRNKKHLMERQIGDLEHFHRNYSYWMWRYPCLNIVQIHERVTARYLRDHKSGIFSAPRWFRHQDYNGPERRAERIEIHRCIRADTWDDHLTGHHARGARRQWRWIIT